MTTTLLRIKSVLIISAIVLFANNLHAATLFENFENPSVASTNNNGATITYPSGSWFTNGITKPSSADERDRIFGLYSQRMRGLDGKNVIYMNFDKAGAGVLSFKYGSYSNHSGGEFTIQKSTNGGTIWETIGSPVTVPKWSGTLLTYSLPVNYNGNIRFKLVVTCRTINNPNEQFNIDDFMVTDYGTEQVAMPTSNVATRIYETPQTVTLASTTAGASIYYTTDGTEPTAASSLYSSPISVSSTTRIRAIAIASDKVNSRIEDLLISFPITVTTLAELTTKMATAGTNLTYFKYTGEAVISHAYSTSTTAAYGTTVTKYAFLQDNTAGVSLKDNNKVLSTVYNQGDKVTNIISQVYNLNNTAQIFPIADFTVLSSNNNITPVVVTLATVNTKPYQLVQLNNILFEGADGIKTFGVNNSVFLKETTVSTFPLRIPSNLSVAPDFQGTIIPTTSRNIVGIVSRAETSFTDFSLFARNAAELNVQLSGIDSKKEQNLFISANKVQFETLVPKSVKVYSVNGQLVKSIVSEVGKNSIALEKGIYLIKIGGAKASKIVL
jgi:hypothetical protein